MEDEIKIEDGSGDKGFFTIVPNFVINHSSANDRALYLEMKRFAGEDGRCFASQETMMGRLKLGRKAFLASLNYLLKRGWVSFIGFTPGKTHPVKTYRVNNIWSENTAHYKGENEIPSRIAVSFEKDTVQKSSKIPSERALEEDIYIRRKKVFLPEVEKPLSEEELTYEPVDDDNHPLKRKKEKNVVNVEVKKVWGRWVVACHKELGVKPTGAGVKDYLIIKSALSKLGEEKIYDLFEEWFRMGKPDDETIQISRALSNYQINGYLARNR